MYVCAYTGFPVCPAVKNLPAMQELQKTQIAAQQPTLVFLPGQAYEQRSLVGYSP